MNEYLLATALLGEGSLLRNLSAPEGIDDWNVRKDQTHIFLGDVSIAIEVVARKRQSQLSRKQRVTYMSNESLILVSKLL